jgi:hypothetical protein
VDVLVFQEVLNSKDNNLLDLFYNQKCLAFHGKGIKNYEQKQESFGFKFTERVE